MVERYYIWTVHQPSHGKRVKKTSALTALVLSCALIGAVPSAVVLSTRSVLSGDGLFTHYGSTGLAEYAVRLSDCIACHSVPDGKPFAGGLAMGTPLGTIYSTNITPDPQTGIGAYGLADFDNAVRHGIAKDGHRLYPAMPYPSYAKLSDDDVKLLYQFFRESVAPVAQPNKLPRHPVAHERALAACALEFCVCCVIPYAPKSNHDASWNRGAYLVQGPGHCGACHTPRGLAFRKLLWTNIKPSSLRARLWMGGKHQACAERWTSGLAAGPRTKSPRF